MKRFLLPLFVLFASVAAAQPPNDQSIVEAVQAKGHYDFLTEDGRAQFVDAVVIALHKSDPRWGHLKKHAGQSNIHMHAEDAALYLERSGLSQAVDFGGGFGGPTPHIAWQVDEPRYTASDWLDPKNHDAWWHPPAPPPPPVVVTPVVPGYAGDEQFDAVATQLFADYAEAGQAPNDGMGRWFARTIYDWVAGNTPTLQASIDKHRREWRAALGLP